MLNYKLGKKGQIGETITWVLATLIIIGIVLISIWISFLMSKSRSISVGDVRIDLGKESEQLTTKTSIAEQLTNNEDKSMIEDILKKQNGG
jgi:Na+-transporting NADH:ubiquinone oxidoreductase subunit NqrF